MPACLPQFPDFLNKFFSGRAIEEWEKLCIIGVTHRCAQEGTFRMEKLYYQIPYVKAFSAEITACTKGKKGYEIQLNRTGFYPEGGGQPSDTGMLGSAKVLEVHEQEEQIIHITDQPLEPGDMVDGIIDWDARFSNMQQHSGEHIVSGLLHARFGYDNVGFHMGHEEMTIDINGVLTWEQLMEIEREANTVIYRNLPVCATYPKPEELETLEYRSKKELDGQVRIVEVPGADRCACCGTHVERTGEIGVIKILSMIHYKGGVRISMLCGAKAMEDYRKKTEQTLRLSALLSAKPEAIIEAVERLKAENTKKDGDLTRISREWLELKADRVSQDGELLLVFEEELTPVMVRQFCDLLLKRKKTGIAAVCSGNDQDGYSYCVGSLDNDMKTVGKKLNEALNGRGGGSKQMIQGSFKAGRTAIEAAFRQEFMEGANDGIKS